MRCIECGSTAVSERSERTAQGYRRFRCHCGKQFNERSESLPNRTQCGGRSAFYYDVIDSTGAR
jgi:hypothetical protein